MEPEHRRNLGRLARSRVVEQFSLAAVVAQYEAVYEEALMNAGGKK
jgi:glycosyltransferase involved in cell wall biosynthesis